MTISREPYGKADGREVSLFTLSNDKGFTAKITNYGGIVTRLMTPDKHGESADVVLGFNTLEEYLKGHPFFGALIGRYGNRIKRARFTLNGKEYRLAVNDGKNHLHGGLKGFDKVVWDAEAVEEGGRVILKLSYLSKDGEENYPGNLSCTVRYIVSDGNELAIEYEATTDRPTVLNLTHHGYFNLSGEGNGDVLDHEIRINARRYTEMDAETLPTGKILPVKGTALDFTEPRVIGSRIGEMKLGYDNNYVLDGKGGSLAFAARVASPGSGRTMEVYTTQPGMQFYTGNYLDGTFTGKSGRKYRKHCGFCLETQHFPDSPNRPEFPGTVLNPGETYRHSCVYRFSI